MAYVGSPGELPAGRAGMVNHENRLLSTPEELLLANGTTFESQLLRKEAGAALFDPLGLVGSPVISASVPTPTKWTLGGGNFVPITNTTPAFIQTTAAGAFVPSPTARTSLPLAVINAAAAGNDILVVATVYADTLQNETYAAMQVTCTDTPGNTYTKVFQTTSSVSGISYVVVGFYATNILALTTADFITITTDTAWFSAIGQADEFSNFATSGALTGSAFGTSTSASPELVMPSPSQLPTMVVGFGALPRGNQTVTATNGFTKTTQNSDAAIGTVWIEYRLFTTQTTIIAMFDWWSQNKPAVAGTVSSTQGSTTITGAGTTFTNYHQNDTIIWDISGATANPETGIIASVTSATSLELTHPASHTVAGADYIIITGPRLITAALDGNLYKERDGDIDDVTLTHTFLGSYSTTKRPGWFVQGGKESAALPRKLFYFNGINIPQVLSADANFTTNITAPAGTDWTGSSQPLAATMHASGGGSRRLVAWGSANDSHRLYFSSVIDHSDFAAADAFQLPIHSHIGNSIYAVVSFQGVLFIFKHPRGIFYLDDSSLDTTNWAVRIKSEGLGCAPSPYAALQIDDDVMFLSPNGSFHLLSAVDTLGGSRASDLSYVLGLQKWLRENLNLERLNQVVSVWYPHKKQALWGVPGAGQNNNSLVLKFDFSAVQRGGPVKFSYSQRDSADALALKQSLTDFVPRPILGEAGFVWLLDQDARNKGGQGYLGMYQLPYLDFSHVNPKFAKMRKQWDHLEIVFAPVSAGTLAVQVFVDNALRQTLTYDATQRRVKHKLSVGDGYNISVVGSNNVADEDFQVLSHIVYMTPGREDTARTQGPVGPN